MVPMNAKVALKSASMKRGELFVTISGTTMMHGLYATSWDMPDKVDINSTLLPLNVNFTDLPISGAIARSRAYFGQGDGQIQIDNVMCSGTENRLQDCTLLRTHNCAHSEDAGVECISKFHIT